MIDATTDAHLWAEKYGGTLDDVFDIQERVSRAIVEALKLRLSPQEDGRIAERPIGNVQAYDCYLKGRQEIELYTKESFDRALDLFRRGLDITGENAVLYAGIAYAYYNHVNIGVEHEEYIAKAEEYAKSQQLVRLHPNVSYNLPRVLLSHDCHRRYRPQSVDQPSLARLTHRRGPGAVCREPESYSQSLRDHRRPHSTSSRGQQGEPVG